jgi:hypothetical protein
MPVADTQIINWKPDFLTSDTNTPEDSSTIAMLLDDEVRNYKSVVRAESTDKAWQRHGLTATLLTSTSFTLPGDQSAVALLGRRVKVLLSGGAVRYGTVKGSSAGFSGTWVVTVEFDKDLISLASIGAAVATNDQITATDTSRFNTSDVVEFAKATTGTVAVYFRQRKVLSVTIGVSVQFATVPPWISDLTTVAPTHVAVDSPGFDNTILEVMFGPVTPVNFESGYPGDLIVGSFDVVLTGLTDTFIVPLPVTMSNAGYFVQLQPIGVVSGTPTSNQWTKMRHDSSTISNFTVKSPLASESGGTVRFDYLIQRDQ